MQRFRPAFEPLENRCNPAGTVTGSFANGTWTLVGDAEANDILISPGAVHNQFTVTGVNGTAVAGVTNASDVKHIVIKMGAGDDYVDVNNTGALVLLNGNLKILGGSGANGVEIDHFKMKSLTIINGNNASGEDELYLTDSIVQKDVAINNGHGSTYTNIYRSNSDTSAIGGNLIVVNGVGEDSTYLNDTQVGGNIVVKNGLPAASDDAGYFEIYNSNNVASRSIVGGNVSVSYQGGTVDYDGIWDTEVLGNVKFNYGSGNGELYIDGYTITQPVHIHGSLTVLGQGDIFVDIGRQYEDTGLIVGKNFTVKTGGGIDTINIDHLSVGGATFISTGGGDDVLHIDNSSFAGATTILTGNGVDTVLVETVAGTNTATQFAKALKVNLGGGDDTMTLGFGGDDTRMVELLAKADLAGGAGSDTLNRFNLVPVFDQPVQMDFEFIAE